MSNTHTCADCGKELERVLYSRRATLAQARQMDAGQYVRRDGLCYPCWKKQDHE